MIDRRAEQCSPLQSARELPRQLFHSIDRRRLGHIFAQHVEVLMQNCAFVGECRFEGWTTVHRVLNLTEDPWVRHRTTTDQHTVATSLTKLVERAFNRRDVATA